MRNVLATTKWVTTSRRVAFSAALTVGIVVLILLTSGRAGAVGLTLELISGVNITQGQSRDFVLDLEIPENEDHSH